LALTIASSWGERLTFIVMTTSAVRASTINLPELARLVNLCHLRRLSGPRIVLSRIQQTIQNRQADVAKKDA
jgi:hypothetical protein